MADKIEKAKKRKRDPDGASKPSKRVALEDQEVKISLQAAEEWAPIVGR
jgi:DNA-directed RNA polymerase I subunit RPA49